MLNGLILSEHVRAICRILKNDMGLYQYCLMFSHHLNRLGGDLVIFVHRFY